jgi:hypothetical protein
MRIAARCTRQQTTAPAAAQRAKHQQPNKSPQVSHILQKRKCMFRTEPPNMAMHQHC